jgi:hypothetical protein
MVVSGDTTPDVGNMQGSVLEYAGTAVTVTTFDNPSAGQEFTLLGTWNPAFLQRL